MECSEIVYGVSFAGRPSRMPTLRGLALMLAVAVVGGLAAAQASAQSVIAASPDVTIALGGSDLVTSDEAVAVDNQLGVVVLENLGAIPESADVTAHAVAANGDRLFALDTTADLGGLVLARGDIARFDGASHTLELDASAAGVPGSAITDAVSIAPGGLLLSFDTTVDLGTVVAADEDLVRWDGANFSMALDGSAVGIDETLDVDAGQDLGSGQFLISLDTTGTVGGITAADEDILRFDGSAWSLEFDASAADADWAAADLDAMMVPEPGFGLSIGLGLLSIRAFARRRFHGAA
jgi:hypothetical protein